MKLSLKTGSEAISLAVTMDVSEAVELTEAGHGRRLSVKIEAVTF